MPMAHILVERVKRGEVEAATKPPHRIALCRLRMEITHVHVRGRQVGIARMEYQRTPQRLPRRTGKMRTMTPGRRRQGVAGEFGTTNHNLLTTHTPLSHTRRANPA